MLYQHDKSKSGASRLKCMRCNLDAPFLFCLFISSKARLWDAGRQKGAVAMLQKVNLSTVQAMEVTFEMQLEFLNVIRNLIAYDAEHAEEPEKRKNIMYVEAFCDTQERVLDTAVRLLNKHRDGLLAHEEKEKKLQEEKKKAEQQIKKEEEEKKKIQDDVKKAEMDEDSLFALGDDEE